MYHEIADDLIRSIQHQLFKEKLPTEQKLMDRYNVSRNTIRKSLDIVCQRGLARRVQGSGYYINNIDQSSKRVVNLTMGISSKEHRNKLTSKVITFDRIVADDALAKQFGAQIGDELHRIIRLRYLDGKEYCLEYAYYEKDEIPYIPVEAAHDSLLDFIDDEYNVRVNSSNQYLSLETLSEEEASLLDMTQKASVLALQQSNFRKNDVLFNFSYTIYVYPDLSFYFHSFNQDSN